MRDYALRAESAAACVLCGERSLRHLPATGAWLGVDPLYLCASCGMVQSGERDDRQVDGSHSSLRPEVFAFFAEQLKSRSVRQIGMAGSGQEALKGLWPNADRQEVSFIHPDTDLTTLSGPQDAAFDVVWLGEALAQLPFPTQTLMHLRSAMSSEGALLMTIRDLAYLEHDDLVEDQVMGPARNFYSVRTLIAQLEVAGFEVEAKQTFGAQHSVAVIARPVSHAAPTRPRSSGRTEADRLEASLQGCTDHLGANRRLLADIGKRLARLPANTTALIGTTALLRAISHYGALNLGQFTLVMNIEKEEFHLPSLGRFFSRESQRTDTPLTTLVILTRDNVDPIRREAQKVKRDIQIIYFTDLMMDARENRELLAAG